MQYQKSTVIAGLTPHNPIKQRKLPTATRRMRLVISTFQSRSKKSVVIVGYDPQSHNHKEDTQLQQIITAIS